MSPHVRSIDIIIPLRNEARYVDTLIRQVSSQAQTLVKRIYLVVAPSDDDTLDRCKSAAVDDSRIVLLENARGTAPFAMNLALERVTADAWIRIDGHTEVPPDLLEVLVHEMNRHGVECVGPTLRPGSRTARQRAIGLAMTSRIGVGNATFRTGRGSPGPTDAVAFGLYRTAATAALGGFNTRMIRNQDDEYNTRLRNAGGRLWLTDRTSVTYFPRATFRALSAQYCQYGLWRFIGTLRFNNQLRPRQAAPLLLVLALVSSGLSLASRRTRRLAPVVPALYASALATKAVRVAVKERDWRTAAQTSVAIAVMHVSYGIGSVRGLLRVLNPPAPGGSER